MKRKRMSVKLAKKDYAAVLKAQAALYDELLERKTLGQTVGIVSRFYIVSKEAVDLEVQRKRTEEKANTHYDDTDDEEKEMDHEPIEQLGNKDEGD